MKTTFFFLASLFAFSCSQFHKKAKMSGLPKTLEEAVKSDFRSSENMRRDRYRNPLATLTFFGVQPDMTVIEISPGAGWYTEILAPLIIGEGRYVLASPPVTKSSPAYAIRNQKKVKSLLGQHPKLKQVEHADFAPLKKADLVRPESADMVLTFRNVHNWVGKSAGEAAFKSFYRALRPGGILGVVEHRAPSGKKVDPKSGYMTEEQVIALAKKAGFKLIAKSEINANPKDSANHPKGVWTLPPSLRLGDKDKAKYQAIGESDRMTLKFVKK